MASRSLRWNIALGVGVSIATLVAACGGSDSTTPGPIGDAKSGGKGGAAGGTVAGEAGAAGSSAGAAGAGKTGGSAGKSGGSAGAAGAKAGGAAGAAGSTAGGGGKGGGQSGGSGGSGGAKSAGHAGETTTGGSTGTAGNTAAGAGGAVIQGFDVEPTALQTITVAPGATMPTVTYSAFVNGDPVAAAWTVDQGNIATIPAGPSDTAAFAPTGAVAGLVNVEAGYNGATVTRQVLVKIAGTQNGSTPGEAGQVTTDPTQLTIGGGIGGVGGEGIGGVVDPGTAAAFNNPTDPATIGLKWLYPYDATVWPRGILAPLLMWQSSNATSDAVQINVATTSGSYSWTGAFSPPAVLGANPFVRHPIPQDVWKAATESAGATLADGSKDKLTVSITVAKDGVAYGPITETYAVAPGRLSGIIYYQSYGTNKAFNFGGAVGANPNAPAGKTHNFGAAVLSIHVGDPAPSLVAGDDNNCRICHSVAAGGSRLTVQQGVNNDVPTSIYDLSPTSALEHFSATNSTYAGLTFDGSKALGANGQMFVLADGSPIPSTGLPNTNLGTPAFSPDSTAMAFNNTNQLSIMDYDTATDTYSNQRVIADFTAQGDPIRPGWAGFFPDSKSVVFQLQQQAGDDGNGTALFTRKNARANIWWTGTADASTKTELLALNGKNPDGTVYLPTLPAKINLACSADDDHAVGAIDQDHPHDETLNYEPTVNPIATGGYAWVVFTSRRLYGNEAVIPPYCSDPRGVDLIENITTKKLWVAAVDLNGTPVVDASHPAFYLPGQELLAGNARGFWVLDPCRADGVGCDAGDECCGGYCEPGAGGALLCQNTPPNATGPSCSKAGEKCAGQSDCCDPGDACVGGFCAAIKP